MSLAETPCSQSGDQGLILLDHRESKGIKKICFTDYAKAFDCVDHNKLWNILNEMEIPDHITCLLRNLYAGQEATVRTVHGTTSWLKIGKEYIKNIYCHPTCLPSMQSASCKMPGWVNHKLESRLLGEISTTSDMQICSVQSVQLLSRV